MRHNAGPRTLITPETYIEKAILTHASKYDYGKTVFSDMKSKVIVTCLTHGDFLVRASHHLYSRQGCALCFRESRKQTTSQFIDKAKLTHGDRYDYSNTVYEKPHDKLTVTCPVHGDFRISAYNHLSGQGCVKCARLRTIAGRKSTLEKFIQKATSYHGDRYDYSESVYVNSKTKLKVICKIHGLFEVDPDHHLSGTGCPDCSLLQAGLARRLTQEDFISKATAKHGDTYDYSESVYVTDRVKVKVRCRVHGMFEISPTKLFSGQGCRLCSFERTAASQRSTLDDFIRKARAKHGNRYDYSESVYVKRTEKIKIICKKHGPFYSVVGNHLRGSGCPLCESSKGENAIREILDKHGIRYIAEYRIPELTSRLHYDFYLPEYRVLIEFHGIQHYQYIPFFHRNGEDDFLVQKNRDDIIRNNALEFRYRYLEFNYKQLKQLNRSQFERMLLSRIKRKH